MYQKNMKNQQGFTLLELLVVVGIIAIIGGAMMASFAGNQAQAARGVSIQTLAGIEGSLRLFMHNTQRLPNNLESLVCTNYNAAGVVSGSSWKPAAITDPTSADAVLDTRNGVVVAAPSTAYKLGGLSNVSGVGGGMSRALAHHFVGTALTSVEAAEFKNRGLSTLRYAMSEACDNIPTSLIAGFAVNGTSGLFGQNTTGLEAIDIPNSVFSDPQPKTITSYHYRGIGFAGNVENSAPVLMWYKGSDVTNTGSSYADSGYNNIKVGAAAHDRLLAFGIGTESDAIGHDGALAKAPFGGTSGSIGRDKYSHYIALFNTGAYAEATPGGPLVTPASANTRLQAIVDARGQFLDGEIAEFKGGVFSD
jgi:prepilin-type N-terminal cleavage/methylation domain-containing protein